MEDCLRRWDLDGGVEERLVGTPPPGEDGDGQGMLAGSACRLGSRRRNGLGPVTMHIEWRWDLDAVKGGDGVLGVEVAIEG
jgi:hypothetical protein